MHPVLVQLGRVAVPSHDFFLGLGVIAAAIVFFAEAIRRDELSEQMLWIVAGTLITGAIGARLSVAWEYVGAASNPTMAGLVAHGGRSILGGLTGAYAGAIVTKHVVGYRRHTGDLFAPAVALGMATGRWGCLLSEQIGTPTTLPWGIRLSPEAASRIANCPAYCSAGVPMHPSFLYEIAFHIAMFAVLWRWLRWRPGLRDQLFRIYLLAYALFRFPVEFVRGNSVVWHGLTGSQIFLIPATSLLLVYFARRWLRGRVARSAPRVLSTPAGREGI